MNGLLTYLTGTTEVKAAQWHANGDHPNDNSEYVALGTETDGEQDVVLSEGKFVRRYRVPGVPGKSVCRDCGYAMDEHGWLDSPDHDGLVVCPGDYVVTNVENDTYPTKPADFESTYRLKVI